MERATTFTPGEVLSIRSHTGTDRPRWTPDGRSIIFVSSIAGPAALWSVDVADGMLSRRSPGLGNLTYSGCVYVPTWSPSGDYISYISASSGSDEVWLAHGDGSPGVQLTTLGGRIESVSWAPDGRSLAVACNRYGSFDIFRVSIPGGKATQLTHHTDYEVYPSYLPDGRLLYVRLNAAWTDHEVILMEGDGSDPRVVLRDQDYFDYHYGREFGYPKVSPDGRSFLFQSERSGWLNTWVAPVSGGAARQIAPAEADQTGAAWSPDGSSIAYLENHNGTVGIRIVSAEGGAPTVVYMPEMGVCSGVSWSPDGSRISYLFGSVTAPNDVYMVNVQDGSTKQLTRSTLGIDQTLATRLVVPEKVVYEGFDGVPIHAYLYRPASVPDGERIPGIVWPHGGPTAQYLDTFQPQVQYIVQQGYVVLLPNVRGSTGFGKAFESLNDRDWGNGDLKDCIAGRDFLCTLPEVNPDAIGITGTSYGGTMAMFAVSFAPPGTFQAAIACSGYCDFVRGYDERELRSQKMYVYELGDRSDPQNYRRFSSLYFVDQASIPCFVLHGEGRYPGSAHSKAFALALEANYKPVWYKAYSGENYYVTGAKVPEMLRDIKAFFDLYLKGIQHNLPEDSRPLTRLSGVISGYSEDLLWRADAAPVSMGPPPRTMEDDSQA